MQLEHSHAASSVVLAEPPPRAAREPAAGDVGRVLIVDDNEINRRVLAGMLLALEFTGAGGNAAT